MQVEEIIKSATLEKHEKGSAAQKISDFYKNILDIEGRNKLGITPIKPYLDMIDKAESADSLTEINTTLQKELCLAPFAAFSLTVDFKDSTKYIPVFDVYEPFLTKDFYISGTESQKSAYFKCLKTLIELSGETADDAKIDKFYEFEKSLAEKMLSTEDKNNVDKFYNTFSPQEIQTMLPIIDTDKILVTDVGLVKEFASLSTNENLDMLKFAAKLSVISGYGGTFSSAFTDASDAFNQEFFGISGKYSDEERAAINVASFMSDYIGKLYAEKHFTQESKQDVLNMIKDILAVFKSRIDRLDWMSSETKEMAKSKLDKMSVKIGYPNEWSTYLDNAEIKSVSEGGSYFENVLSIAKAARSDLKGIQGTSSDKTKWIIYPHMANACYIATSNDITFPAAILQSPLYDVSASYEENLGGIGYVIAHEITHAFDNNGAKFDENGNASDWWNSQDYAEFENLCEKIVNFYDGSEAITGIPMNGRLTLSENVADQGAVQCITEVASKLDNPDYKTLYRSMAKNWASTKTREYAQYAAAVDVHSDEKLRVNRVVVNCDEFYSAFGIGESDGMWVSPQDRVKIW